MRGLPSGFFSEFQLSTEALLPLKMRLLVYISSKETLSLIVSSIVCMMEKLKTKPHETIKSRALACADVLSGLGPALGLGEARWAVAAQPSTHFSLFFLI